MKTKLEMAHDYLRDIVSNWEYDDSFDPVAEAWQYADAMQAEADKRIKAKAKKDAEKSKVFFEKLTKNEDGSCKHFHTTLNRGECFDCGEKLNMADSPQLEWQPDWSQAPRCDVVAWDINEHGQGRWIASDNGYYLAPSFGYTGDWRESLRKRPQ